MDEFTPETPPAQDFNDYRVETYVCQQSSRYTVELWNVCDNIRQKFPGANNAVEGYNYRMSTVFSSHSHIHEFIGCLKGGHVCRHHKADAIQVQKSLEKNI